MLRATDSDVCNACGGRASERCAAEEEVGEGPAGRPVTLAVKRVNLESLRNYRPGSFSFCFLTLKRRSP